MTTIGMRHAAMAALATLAMGLAGCGSDVPVEANYPQSGAGRDNPVVNSKDVESQQTVFGEGGLNLFGGSKPSEGGGAGLGVNSYLWRASLDTISFMPLSSADPFGGVIITDWYSPPGAKDERFKMNIYILGRELRADGLKVALFHQAKSADGSWQPSTVAPETGTNLENEILTRARQLRMAQASR
jgi:Domain of unknown function (DUF3576)